MEECFLLVMVRDQETGVITKELCGMKITGAEFLSGIYAMEEEGGVYLHLLLTTPQDLADWEFQAVYDYYDEEAITGLSSFEEVDGVENPTWEAVVKYENQREAEILVEEILQAHKAELESVYEVIKDKKDEYESYS